jgi:hypothetical protein
MAAAYALASILFGVAGAVRSKGGKAAVAVAPVIASAGVLAMAALVLATRQARQEAPPADDAGSGKR